MKPEQSKSPGGNVYCTSASYRILEKRLLEFASRARSASAGLPILAVVPSYRTASRLSEVLGKGLKAQPGGVPLPGVQFMTAPELAGRHSSLPMCPAPLVITAAYKAVRNLEDTPYSGRMGPLLNPSGVSAAAEAVSDLLEGGFLPDVLHEASRPLNPHERDSARFAGLLLSGFLEALKSEGRTIPELEMLRPGPAGAARYSALVVYGFYDLTKAQEYLVTNAVREFESAGKSVGVFSPVAPLGREYAARTGRFIETLLGPPDEEPAGAGEPTPALILCSSEREEAVRAAHRVKGAVKKNLPADSIVVTARDISAFMMPLAAALEREGIPYRLGAGAPLSTTGPGGALKEALSQCRADRTAAGSSGRPGAGFSLYGFLSVLARAGSRYMPLVAGIRRALSTANVLTLGEVENCIHLPAVRRRLGEDAGLLDRYVELLQRLFDACTLFAEGDNRPLLEWFKALFHPAAEGLGETLRLIIESSVKSNLPPLFALDALFRRRTFRPPDDNRGVLICDLMAARNVTARLGILLGAREGLLPAARREPPLLPFSLREGLNEASDGRGYLPTRRLHLAEERMLLGLFLHNCEEMECSYSPPARGFPVKSSILLEYPVVETSASSHRHGGGALPAALKGGAAKYLDGLLSREYLPHEGNLGVNPAADEARRERFSVSASFFNEYLTCPYRAFVNGLLQAPEDPRPALDPVTPDEWGRIIHQVMTELMRKGGGKPPPEVAIRRHFREAFDKLNAAGMVRRVPFLESRLSRFLPRLARWARSLIPEAGTEMDCELRLEFDERNVKFKAVLDRLEKKDDGGSIVDYKTGSPSGYKGYYGQLFIYLHSVAGALGYPWENLQAALAFLHYRSSSLVMREYPAPGEEAAREALTASIQALTTGEFIKAPAGDCTRCPVLRMCILRGDRMTDRKGSSPAFLRLEEIRSIVSGKNGGNRDE